MAATSMTGIVGEPARKSAFTAAVAAEPSQAEKDAAAQTAHQEHVVRSVKAWAARAEANSDTAKGTCAFRENGITPAVLDAWETELTAAGYVVTRDKDVFTVALSP